MENKPETPLQIVIDKIGGLNPAQYHLAPSVLLIDVLKILEIALPAERAFAEMAYSEGGCDALNGKKPEASFNEYYKRFENKIDELRTNNNNKEE